MAAVTRTKCRPVTPTAYEYNDKGFATEDILRGQLVRLTSDGVSLNNTAGGDPAGIALKDAKTGMMCEYGVHGEMDGFSGLTIGAALYPSSTVAGGIDTTVFTDGPVRMRAVTATRIRFMFV